MQYLNTNIPTGGGIKREIMSNVLFWSFRWEMLFNSFNLHVLNALDEKGIPSSASYILKFLLYFFQRKCFL